VNPIVQTLSEEAKERDHFPGLTPLYPDVQMKLETQLVNISKKTKNNLTLYEIVYNIHFGSNDKQQNKLKILVKNI